MFKLGLHLQHLPSWHVDVVDNSNIEWVKMIHPSGEYPYHRAVKVNGRIWLDEDAAEWAKYGMQGEAGAEAYFRDCLPYYKEAPWVHAWEAINEWPPYWGEMHQYNKFGSRWIDLMHSEGMRTIAGSISAGQPPAGHIHLLEETLEKTDYFALHEYSHPTMQTDQSWLCLRYRRTYKELEDRGIRRPPLLITEVGIDGGAAVPGKPKTPGTGWITWAIRDSYKEQLSWYEEELGKDDYVECGEIFVSGGDSNWRDFEFDEELARWLGVKSMAIPYYYQSRQGYPITHIVLHDTEGSARAAEAWFRDPNNPGRSSAHKIVTASGEEWNIVPDNLGANHAGFAKIPGMEGINPNLFSLGLEMEYPAFPATPPWPDVQVKKAAEIVKRWANIYQIPRWNVSRHETIDPTRRSDPRNWDEQAFLNMVYGTLEQELAVALQAIIVPLNANAALEGAAAVKGYLPASDELRYNGYVCQAFREASNRLVQRIAYCKEGDWGNIHWFTVSN